MASRKRLKNAAKRIFSYKFRFDTAENEPAKKLRKNFKQCAQFANFIQFCCLLRRRPRANRSQLWHRELDGVRAVREDHARGAAIRPGADCSAAAGDRARPMNEDLEKTKISKKNY